ncbi:MAG: hypothetical protein ACRDHN_20980, partial [Thermomicrobiales bacterium]
RIEPAVPGCSITELGLTCSVNSIPSGGSIVVSITGIADAQLCGYMVNEASVTAGNEPTGSTENNTDSATVTVYCPDPAIQKTAARETLSAGQSIQYFITVSNPGQGTAHGVVVTDVLPVGFAWETFSNGCSIADGTLTCDLGDLAENQVVNISVSAPTEAVNCGSIVNVADMTATNLPPDHPIEDLSSTATVEINCPDMVVEKVPDLESVNALVSVGFTITMTNNGDGVGYGAYFTDFLPQNEGLVWSIDGGTSPADCEITDNTYLYCNADSLVAGGTFFVHITSPTTPQTCGDVTNYVNAYAAFEPEATHGDNNANATVTVNCPDVVVEKTPDVATITIGDEIGFSITIGNTGEGLAYDAFLTDVLPSGIDWIVDEGVQQVCAITSGTLNCRLGDLAPGDERVVHIHGTTDVDNCGSIENTAVVSGTNEAEADTGNNSSTATVTITCANVVVTKTGDDGDGGTVPLENACFELIDGGTTFGPVCTDENGLASFLK